MKKSTTFVIFHAYLLVFNACAVVLCEVGDANKYVDDILKKLRESPELVAQFDPLKLPSFDGGDYQVYDGVVRGLSHLYRNGDCSVGHDKDGVTTVSGQIAVDGVHLSTRYAKKVGFLWIRGDADGKVRHLSMQVELSVLNGQATLQKLQVADLGDYYITRISGASLMLNWLVKIIVNVILKRNRGLIIGALENGAANALQDVLSKIDVPF